jgi:two-component system, NarL family, invasion response regulator UvrY
LRKYRSIPLHHFAAFMMAEELNVSYKTVVNACSQLKQKLNAKILPELIRAAVQLVSAES